jgi:hypothetical protein
MIKAKRDLRAMRLAAMAGDANAARALLKLYGFREVAAEIKSGLPFSNRVRRAVDALTAGTNTKWEVYNEVTGEFENDLQFDPPPRRARARAPTFED